MPPYRAPVEGGTYDLTTYDPYADPALADPNYVPPPPAAGPDMSQDPQAYQAQPTQIAPATPEAAATNPQASYAYGTGQPYYDTGYAPPEQAPPAAPAPEAAATLPAQSSPVLGSGGGSVSPYSSYDAIENQRAAAPVQPYTYRPGPGQAVHAYDLSGLAYKGSQHSFPTGTSGSQPPVMGATPIPANQRNHAGMDNIQRSPDLNQRKKGPNAMSDTTEQELNTVMAAMGMGPVGSQGTQGATTEDIANQLGTINLNPAKGPTLADELWPIALGHVGGPRGGLTVEPVGANGRVAEDIVGANGRANGKGRLPPAPEFGAPVPESAAALPEAPPRGRTSGRYSPQPEFFPPEALGTRVGPDLPIQGPLSQERLVGPLPSETIQGPRPDDLLPLVDYGPTKGELVAPRRMGPRKSELLRPVDYGPTTSELVTPVDMGPTGPLQGPLPSERIAGPRQAELLPPAKTTGKPVFGSTNGKVNPTRGRPTLGASGESVTAKAAPPNGNTKTLPPLPTAAEAAPAGRRSLPLPTKRQAAGLGILGAAGAVATGKVTLPGTSAPATAATKTPAQTPQPQGPMKRIDPSAVKSAEAGQTALDKALAGAKAQGLVDSKGNLVASQIKDADKYIQSGKWTDAAATDGIINADDVGKPISFMHLKSVQKGTPLETPAREATDADVAGSGTVTTTGNTDTSSGTYSNNNDYSSGYTKTYTKKSYPSGGGSSRSYGRNYSSGGYDGGSGYASRRSSGGGGFDFGSDFGGGSFDWHDFLNDTDGDGEYSPAEIKAAKKKAKMARMKRGKGTKGGFGLKGGKMKISGQAANPQIRADILAALESSTGREMPSKKFRP